MAVPPLRDTRRPPAATAGRWFSRFTAAGVHGGGHDNNLWWAGVDDATGHGNRGGEPAHREGIEAATISRGQHQAGVRGVPTRWPGSPVGHRRVGDAGGGGAARRGPRRVRPPTSAQHGIYSSSPPNTPPRPRDSARPVTGSQHSAPVSVSALSSVKPSKAWAANRRWPVNCEVTMFLGIAVTEALALIGLVAGFIF